LNRYLRHLETVEESFDPRSLTAYLDCGGGISGAVQIREILDQPTVLVQ
jgi:hypothetical protein